MSNPGKFADVIKAASDLLTKPFVADRKVSFKTVTDNKITVSGESVKESGANNKSITSSKLAFKFKATNDINVSKLEFTNLGRITVEADAKPLKDFIDQDVKMTIKLETGADGLADPKKGTMFTDVGSVDFEYNDANVNATVGFNAATYDPNASFLAGYENFIFGGSVNGKDGALDEFQTALGVVGKNSKSVFKTSKKCKVFEFTHEVKVSDDLNIAAVAKHSRATVTKDKKEVKAVTDFSLAGKYSLVALNLPEAAVNFKVDAQRRSQLAYIHSLRKGTELTVSGDLSKDFVLNSFGVGLAFTF